MVIIIAIGNSVPLRAAPDPSSFVPSPFQVRHSRTWGQDYIKEVLWLVWKRLGSPTWAQGKGALWQRTVWKKLGNGLGTGNVGSHPGKREARLGVWVHTAARDIESQTRPRPEGWPGLPCGANWYGNSCKRKGRGGKWSCAPEKLLFAPKGGQENWGPKIKGILRHAWADVGPGKMWLHLSYLFVLLSH